MDSDALSQTRVVLERRVIPFIIDRLNAYSLVVNRLDNGYIFSVVRNDGVDGAVNYSSTLSIY